MGSFGHPLVSSFFGNYVSHDEFYCLRERIVSDNNRTKGTGLGHRLLASLNQNELIQLNHSFYTLLVAIGGRGGVGAGGGDGGIVCMVVVVVAWCVW